MSWIRGESTEILRTGKNYQVVCANYHVVYAEHLE